MTCSSLEGQRDNHAVPFGGYRFVYTDFPWLSPVPAHSAVLHSKLRMRISRSTTRSRRCSRGKRFRFRRRCAVPIAGMRFEWLFAMSGTCTGERVIVVQRRFSLSILHRPRFRCTATIAGGAIRGAHWNTDGKWISRNLSSGNLRNCFMWSRDWASSVRRMRIATTAIT